jgi:hypothetical protein
MPDAGGPLHALAPGGDVNSTRCGGRAQPFATGEKPPPNLGYPCRQTASKGVPRARIDSSYFNGAI